MTRRLAPTALTVLLVAAGCSNNNSNQAGNIPRTDFEKIKDPPINANTHFAAGQLAEAQGDNPHAMKQYREAIKQEPNHPSALYRLGVLLAQDKQYGEAVEIWQKYVKATGGSATGYSNLAFCEELWGHPEIAEGDYQRGIAKDPVNEPCRVNYGFMLARHGRTHEAVLQFQRVLSPAQVHYDLGTVYEGQGRNAQAHDEYKKATDLDPSMADAKTKLAALPLN